MLPVQIGLWRLFTTTYKTYINKVLYNKAWWVTKHWFMCVWLFIHAPSFKLNIYDTGTCVCDYLSMHNLKKYKKGPPVCISKSRKWYGWSHFSMHSYTHIFIIGKLISQTNIITVITLYFVVLPMCNIILYVSYVVRIHRERKWTFRL